MKIHEEVIICQNIKLRDIKIDSTFPLLRAHPSNISFLNYWPAREFVRYINRE